MTVPDSMRRGQLEFAMSGWLPVVAGVLLLVGCASTVTGHPVVTTPTDVQRHIGAQLSALLPDPAQFPARYPAVVLPPEAATQAAGDLTGIGRGSTVRPEGCLPPVQRSGPDRTAIAVGTDNDSRATLTVELTRNDLPLSALRNQLKRCETMQVARAGATTTVTTRLEPPPPIDADDALALRRTVAPEVGEAGLTQSMQTLTGQVGDVRIAVTYMSFSDAKPDTAALDKLFTTAVQRVKQA
ncbi:sensor domain-containing protein [Nocardia sp. NPDC051463]|uniref:sensor domain-containing protein n=1 Tax=Nocardia sp. NPDC051463 TaxID=3154845 RepID=UPI00341CBCA9